MPSFKNTARQINSKAAINWLTDAVLTLRSTDGALLTASQQGVYKYRMNSVDELKQHLVNWYVAQSAAERYWCSRQWVEKATDSVHACRTADEDSEHLQWAYCETEKVMDT